MPPQVCSLPPPLNCVCCTHRYFPLDWFPCWHRLVSYYDELIETEAATRDALASRGVAIDTDLSIVDQLAAAVAAAAQALTPQRGRPRPSGRMGAASSGGSSGAGVDDDVAFLAEQAAAPAGERMSNMAAAASVDLDSDSDGGEFDPTKLGVALRALPTSSRARKKRSKKRVVKVRVDLGVDGDAAASDTAGTGVMMRMAMGVGRDRTSDLPGADLCRICNTRIWHAVLHCPCRPMRIACADCVDALCACGPASYTLHVRHTLDDLRQMRAAVAEKM